MRSITLESTVSALIALAVFAVAACGGQPESGAADDAAAGAEQESPAQAMAAEGEQGAEPSAMEGGEHGGEVEGGEGGETDEGGDGHEAGEHDEGGEHGEEGEHGERGEGAEHGEGGERGEHDEGGEHGARGEHGEGEHGEEGEESGEYLSRAESWDATRRGIRLRLIFDAERDAFVGTAENTTDGAVCAVRVEVHLRPGPELGPTERRDLAPGESTAVELAAGGQSFEEWTAHPETSACEAT